MWYDVKLHKTAVVPFANLPIAAITDRDSMTSSARLVHYILAFETNALSFPAISNGGLHSINMTGHKWNGLYQENYIAS